MKYYIIAGESSGDLYGALLMQKLKAIDSSCQFRYWGGPKMKEQSEGQFKSIEETAFMGFIEVLKNIIKIKALFNDAKNDILEWKADILIFIDYPGFNLRMAQWAKLHKIKTCYYISPQLWAWKEGRHKILRDTINLFFVILPFERDFYKNLDTPCEYVGHPLLEKIEPKEKIVDKRIETIGLFPGSRKQEVKKHLPIMVKFASKNPDYKFVIGGLSHINKSIYLNNIPTYLKNMDIIFDGSYDLMNSVDAAITSSGTASLELALFNVPQIVIYKMHPIGYQIGKVLVKSKFISLVNLISQKKVVSELIQSECTVENLNESFEYLKSNEIRIKMINQYKKIREDLGDGTASQRVAERIYKFLN